MPKMAKIGLRAWAGQYPVFLVTALGYPFYRAMHYSAKRGIAIACRLSVCPSVRL